MPMANASRGQNALRRRFHREGLRRSNNVVPTTTFQQRRSNNEVPTTKFSQRSSITKFFSTPDSSGKPLSEARSLERIAGKGSEKIICKWSRDRCVQRVLVRLWVLFSIAKNKRHLERNIRRGACCLSNLLQDLL